MSCFPQTFLPAKIHFHGFGGSALQSFFKLPAKQQRGGDLPGGDRLRSLPDCFGRREYRSELPV